MKTQHKNSWDVLKIVLRGKFLTLSDYIQISERAQMNDLIMQTKNFEKLVQTKPKPS